MYTLEEKEVSLTTVIMEKSYWRCSHNVNFCTLYAYRCEESVCIL